MEDVRVALERWDRSLRTGMSVAGFLARCPVAHKWKAPYRAAVLREALFWRMHDLLRQSMLLADKSHLLGARILLRSAIETLGLLIYTKQKIRAVLSGSLSFFEFEEITKKLLIGSKNSFTPVSAFNIVTVLAQAEKDQEGLEAMHQRLSESAHPNFDGVLMGYSTNDPDQLETRFGNNWLLYHGAEHEPGVAFVIAVFEEEYAALWSDLLKLEDWLRVHDVELEAQRDGR